MLGGSSGLNYMLAVRGEGADYDSWAEVAKDCCKSFLSHKHVVKSRQLETHHGIIPPSFHTFIDWKKILVLRNPTPQPSLKTTL